MYRYLIINIRRLSSYCKYQQLIPYRFIAIRKFRKPLRYNVIRLIVILLLLQSLYYVVNNLSRNHRKAWYFPWSPFSAIVNRNITSLCSSRAAQRGLDQKIISISFFGPVENPQMFLVNKSLAFLQELIDERQQVYADDWILRIYHDEKILNQTMIDHFEQNFDFVDFCNVKSMNLDFIPPRIWRFLPAGDETVRVMLSRDLDSPLTPRERAAVDEWLSSNLSFHSMRDHPFHVTSMMAGMWGFHAGLDRNFSKTIRSVLCNRTIITTYARNTDQNFLGNYLWPYAGNNAMTHDSYLCSSTHWNRFHRPFPTQRPLRNMSKYCFIGCPKPCCTDSNFLLDPCPTECRPKQHQDWIYC